MRIALALLLAAAPAFAQNGDEIRGAREAKHLITPFVGYQALNGEQRGLDYDILINDPSFPDTTFHFSGSFDGTRNANPPVLGVAYRYLMTPKIQIEGQFSFMQDKADFKYPVTFDFFGFRQQRIIPVHRTNLTALNLDGLYAFDTPWQWLSGAGRIGAGYAWRDVSSSLDFYSAGGAQFKFDVKDADQLFSVRAGCDLYCWKSDNLILQTGLNYSLFFPMGTDGDAFGGFGWRASVFPIWSDQSGD